MSCFLLCPHRNSRRAGYYEELGSEELSQAELPVLRDLVFQEKRQRAKDRHAKERLAFIRKTGSLTYPIQ